MSFIQNIMEKRSKKKYLLFFLLTNTI